MKIAGDGLVIIGENFNATRKIKITSPKVIQQDGKVGIGYVDAHLLASVRLSSPARLWTRDKRLHAAATALTLDARF